MAAFLSLPGRMPFRVLPPGRSVTLVALLLSLGAGAVTRAGAQEPTPQDTARVTVPDVTGLTLPEATKRLAAVGLEVGPAEWVSAAAAPGTVVRQWPTAGSSVVGAGPARAVARLTLATAPAQAPAAEPRTVPALAGRTLEEARQLLESVGLKAGEVTRVPGDAEGTVLGQSTPAGTTVPPGTGVDLQVSAGPAAAPTEVQVPDLVGQTMAQATAALAGLKLRILRVDSEATTSGGGTILRQLPAAGARVAESTGITLVQAVAASPAAPAAVPETAAAAPAEAVPATPSAPWRKLVRVLLALAALVALAAAGLALRHRSQRQAAPTEIESGQKRPEPPSPAAAQGPRVSPASPAAAEAGPQPSPAAPVPTEAVRPQAAAGPIAPAEGRESQPSPTAPVPTQVPRPQLAAGAGTRGESRRSPPSPVPLAPPAPRSPGPSPGPIAPAEAREPQPTPVPSAPTAPRSPEPSPGRMAPARAAGPQRTHATPAADSVQLSTIWDFGSVTLEVAGPLEAAPAVPSGASGDGDQTEAEPRPVLAGGAARLPSVRAVLAGGVVLTPGLGAFGASVSAQAGAERFAAGAAPDELGARILSAILTALEIPLASVLAEAWSGYDAFQEYLDPARYPPEQTTALTLAPHTAQARFRPVVELWLEGESRTTLHPDVELAIALESGMLTIQAGRFTELRPGGCAVSGAIRCGEATLLERPLSQLALAEVVGFGAGIRIRARREVVEA